MAFAFLGAYFVAIFFFFFIKMLKYAMENINNQTDNIPGYYQCKLLQITSHVEIKQIGQQQQQKKSNGSH